MKTLRFRAVEVANGIRCGSKNNFNADGKFPIHYIWYSGGGSATMRFSNYGDAPIKLKVYVDGNLYEETSYIGNPSYQQDLDDYNNNNFHPLETIEDIDSIDVLVSTTVNSVVDLKIYCPLQGSEGELDVICE